MAAKKPTQGRSRKAASPAPSKTQPQAAKAAEANTQAPAPEKDETHEAKPTDQAQTNDAGTEQASSTQTEQSGDGQSAGQGDDGQDPKGAAVAGQTGDDQVGDDQVGGDQGGDGEGNKEVPAKDPQNSGAASQKEGGEPEDGHRILIRTRGAPRHFRAGIKVTRTEQEMRVNDEQLAALKADRHLKVKVL